MLSICSDKRRELTMSSEEEENGKEFEEPKYDEDVSSHKENRKRKEENKI
jgi:hypothetical protein